MKCSLSTRTKFVNLVLSLKDDKSKFSKDLSDNAIEEVKRNLSTWCSNDCSLYAYILHDRDINKEDGSIKTKHIHCVCELKSNQRRLSSVLHDVADACNLNVLAISIEKSVSTSSCIQYLIHKNDEDKYQYNKDDIVSNLEREELDMYLNDNSPSFTIDTIINSVIKSDGNRLLIMRSIGLSYYHVYRREIEDIIHEFEMGLIA